MKYIYIIITVLFVVLLGTVTVLIDTTISQKNEIERLGRNQTTLNDSVIHYRTKSGDYATSVHELIYSVKELKKYDKENAATIKDLGLKFKQVQDVINTGIITIFHDTLIKRDTVILNDTVSIFRKKDDYIDLIGVIRKDTVLLDFRSTDTITSVAHWNYRKWWIFKCKDKKSISLETTNKNPYTRIVYSRYVKIK